MKYIKEFRDKDLVKKLLTEIHHYSKSPVRLMEVCGGHTMSIQKFGIPHLLPENIRLLSGPGCPVCVTDRKYIDQCISYSRMPNTIITTYGDLIRVPGSSSSLEKERAANRDIRVVYSITDALKIAEENPEKEIIFLGIGFETTTPESAIGILMAQKRQLKNFSVFSAHKIMPPPMKALIDEDVQIDGYIGPGHVSTITGTSIFDFIPESYKLGVVITGFEPIDLLQSILMLVKQFEQSDPKVEIQYGRSVKSEGNLVAIKQVETVFELRDDWWRGLGILENSGLGIRQEFSQFDAEKKFLVEVEPTREDKACICGQVLKGAAIPTECKLFEKVCSPADPIGACMVSSEGACHAYYKFQKIR